MKIKKIIIVLILILSILFVFQTKVHGSVSDDLEKIKTGMKDVTEGDASSTEIIDTMDMVFYLIRYVGSGVSIIVVLGLGMKYMTSSIEDKAEIKKRAVPIVIGCVILFGTSNLISILMGLFD